MNKQEETQLKKIVLLTFVFIMLAAILLSIQL